MKPGHFARYLLCLGLYYSGIYLIVRWSRRISKRPRVVVLSYHSFSTDLSYLDMAIPPALMAKQVDFLRDHFQTLTLSQLVSGKRRPDGIDRDTAVVTVDDGYADNYAPLLDAAKRARVPSTVFLTTGCIDAGHPTSVMWVVLAIHHATISHIHVPELGLGSLAIETADEKEAAIHEIDSAIKPLSEERRRTVIDALVSRCGAAALVRERAGSLMLTWEQVGRLHGAGVEFGGHSLTHPVLSGLAVEEARREIEESIARVKVKTGEKVVPFAYPYGSNEDVGPIVRRLCHASGASAAVMLVEGRMPGDDDFAIPRTMVRIDRATNPWGHYSKAVWACELEGLVDRARLALSLPRTLMRSTKPGRVASYYGAPAPTFTTRGNGAIRKVMYLVDFYERLGGSEGQLRQLIRYLDRTRYEPALTALRPSAYLEKNPPPCAVSVLNVNRLTSLRSIARVVRFGLRMRREGYGLVHCYYNDTSMIAPPILWLLGVRTIVSRRDMGFWHTPQTLAVTKRVSRFATRYVVNSGAVKRAVQQQEGVPADKITVIYNGYLAEADDEFAKPVSPRIVPLPQGVRIIGVVANVKPVKRLDTMVEAFAQIASRHTDTIAVIVGADFPNGHGGSVMRDLRDLAARRGIGDRIIFTGGVEQPVTYIRQFDVAVLCSDSEGFSNAIIEYMAEGRPVVCTDTGGNPELVRDGVNGYLVPVGDAKALGERIAALLDDPLLACRMGEAGREIIRTRYTHTRMVAEQMACYDEILAGREAPMHEAAPK